MSLALVSDGCHYLPAATVAELDLHQVPLYVHRDGAAMPETEITDLAAFYRSLAGDVQLPTTSQPSVGDFLATYEPLLAAGDEIVSIHLSGGISGTVRAAAQAREALDPQLRERVHVVDSESAAGGMALMLLAADAARRAGEDATGAVARAAAVRAPLRLRFAVDTLEYLRRGGRIGDAQAWLGTALRLKPILEMATVITPVERVRTSRRAFEHLVSMLADAHDNDGADTWLVHHVQAPERAAELVAAGREIFGTEPLMVTEVGPVVGTHVGPGVLAAGATKGAPLS